MGIDRRAFDIKAEMVTKSVGRVMAAQLLAGVSVGEIAPDTIVAEFLRCEAYIANSALANLAACKDGGELRRFRPIEELYAALAEYKQQEAAA